MHETRTPRRWIFLASLASALAGGLAALSHSTAAPADTQAAVRCATRLSIAFLGTSPSPELLASSDPQALIAELMADPAFADRFARFVNASFNEEPGMIPVEDASYFLARKVIEDDLPWSDLFIGEWRVEPAVDAQDRPTAQVVADPDGLGYFRSPDWMRRYAGNEEDGYRLTAAYRIQQNTIGLNLAAVDSVPDADLSASGRMAPACRGCHYDNYYALDKVAKVLSRRVGEGDEMTFIPPDEGPQEILGGQLIANDEELVHALVESVDFEFNTCRLVFRFLYGREEAVCEGAVFDACVDALRQTGTVQAAIAAVAEDPGFCE